MKPAHPIVSPSLFLALCLVPALRAADIEAVQKTAVEWAKIRTETVRLETDWAWQKQLLNSTNGALADRVRQLEAKRDELQAKTAADRNELADLAAKNTATSAAISTADQHTKEVAAKLIQLRATLPPRLSQALELPYRSLASPTLTSGERMQYVTTILNRCAQFNKTITSGDEALSLSGDAEPKLLNVIYWGLGQGYALDRVNGKAYYGGPRTQGWTWEPADASAKPIARLLSIFQEKSDPEFVEVPVRLSHIAAKTQP